MKRSVGRLTKALTFSNSNFEIGIYIYRLILNLDEQKILDKSDEIILKITKMLFGEHFCPTKIKSKKIFQANIFVFSDIISENIRG